MKSPYGVKCFLVYPIIMIDFVTMIMMTMNNNNNIVIHVGIILISFCRLLGLAEKTLSCGGGSGLLACTNCHLDIVINLLIYYTKIN